MITTSNGTTVILMSSDGIQMVIADNPDAPEDMRNCELGRVVDGGFQPAMFVAWAIRPDVLRGIADIIDDL